MGLGKKWVSRITDFIFLEVLLIVPMPKLGNLAETLDSIKARCVSSATNLTEEINCPYKSYRPWDFSSTVVRATAPEGNLTQGEIVFETVKLPNGTSVLRFKEGFGVEVMYSLQVALGFQIQVVTAKSWATQFPNKSWFGMAQQIIDGEADLSLAKTSILPNRAQDLGYLVPTHGLGLYAFFVQPASSGKNIFIEPFHELLWLALLIIYIILIIVVRTISTVAKHKIGLEEMDKILSDEVTIWSFHAICQHGFHSWPSLSCLRVAVVTGVLLGLIVYISYSAQLVSIFSIVTLPIKDIEGLLRSTIPILFDKANQRATNMIQDSADVVDPISDKLKAHVKMQKQNMTLTADAGMYVLRGQGSFITFKDSFFTTIKNTYGTKDEEFCKKLSLVPVSGTQFKSGLFVRKGSPLKEPFNVKTVAMYTAGLMKRYVDSYEETYTPRCSREGLTTSIPEITMADVTAAFYGLGIGYALCLVMSLAEILWLRMVITIIPTKTDIDFYSDEHYDSM